MGKLESPKLDKYYGSTKLTLKNSNFEKSTDFLSNLKE